MTRPRSLNDLIRQHESPLGNLVRRAEQLEKLTRTLRTLLPPAERPHLLGVNYRGSQLVLITDSPVWAARLRFHAQARMAEIGELAGIRPRSISVKVRPG